MRMRVWVLSVHFVRLNTCLKDGKGCKRSRPTITTNFLLTMPGYYSKDTTNHSWVHTTGMMSIIKENPKNEFTIRRRGVKKGALKRSRSRSTDRHAGRYIIVNSLSIGLPCSSIDI